MTWIAVTGDGQNWIDPSLSARRMTGIDRPMRRGTVMIEATRPSPSEDPVLIRLNRSGGAQGVVSLQWVPGTGIVLIVTQRDQVFHATLPVTEAPQGLRICYSWDLDTNSARLAAEDPVTGLGRFQRFSGPLPIFLSDFWSLTRKDQDNAQYPTLSGGIDYLAVSEAVEPIGPQPGLLPDTLLDGPDGPRALADLAPGDLLRSMTGDLVPVVAVITRTVPATGGFRPWGLSGRGFGSARGLTVAAGQELVIGGSGIDHNHDGTPHRVAARDLPPVCAHRVGADPRRPLVTYAQVILPEAEAITCQGTSVQSVNLGQLARDKAYLAETLLAGQPRARLPDHLPSPYRRLDPAEARNLSVSDAA